MLNHAHISFLIFSSFFFASFNSDSKEIEDDWVDLQEKKVAPKSFPRDDKGIIQIPQSLKKTFTNDVTFYLNGVEQTVSNADPTLTLAVYLKRYGNTHVCLLLDGWRCCE